VRVLDSRGMNPVGNTTVTSKHVRGSFLKTLFTLMVGLYVAALACYLILRALFGDRFWWLSLVNTFAYVLFLPLLVLLPLALLLGMRRNTLRLIPLALIGGLWFAPYYLPKSQMEASGQTLRVLTFNVWGHNKTMANTLAWVKDQDADIVLLQELIPYYVDKLLPDLYEVYPYHFAQEDEMRWRGALNSNFILSRYPIVDVQTIDLKTPDTANPLRIVLDVNGEFVAVYNVHLAWPGGSRTRLPIPRFLDSTYSRLALSYNDSPRNNQIANLLAHLENEPYPYIVGGDFNTSDQSPTYDQLAARMKDSFREAGAGFGGSWPVGSVRGMPAFIPPLVRIDYIWHSDHFRALEAQQGPPLGSDHLALVATLSLSSFG